MTSLGQFETLVLI